MLVSAVVAELASLAMLQLASTTMDYLGGAPELGRSRIYCNQEDLVLFQCCELQEPTNPCERDDVSGW